MLQLHLRVQVSAGGLATRENDMSNGSEKLGEKLNQLNAKQPKPVYGLADRRHLLQAVVSQRTYNKDQREQLWAEIAETVLSKSKVMRNDNFQVTTGADLQRMAELYDQKFFDGHCLAIARSYGIDFRWSKRMTSNGGKTVRYVQPNRRDTTQSIRYEIVLSATLLFQTFGDLDRPVRVTGLLCKNRLQAMQRILEHEMIHLVEMLVWEDSCCAAPRFQTIASRMFGHTEHKHNLITQQERASEKFNVRVGSNVHFALEGTRYIGIVNRITRRATVLVVDPQGQLYGDGKRYRKFYVPLSHLELVHP